MAGANAIGVPGQSPADSHRVGWRCGRKGVVRGAWSSRNPPREDWSAARPPGYA